MNFEKLINRKLLLSLLLGLNFIVPYLQASIYEATLTGSDDYDDATLELGLQDTDRDALMFFGEDEIFFGRDEIDHSIFKYREEIYDLSSVSFDGFSYVFIISDTSFLQSDHSDIDLFLSLEISNSLYIENNGGNTYSNRFSNDVGSWTLTSFGLQSAVDTGDATYSISGDTYAGKTLTAAVSTDDPDGNGTVTSYTWQSSSDGSSWSPISGATSSTYNVTSAEEGKYIRVLVEYTDGSNTSESVTASSVSISQLHTEWVQPYSAMQNIGLKSIHNNRDLVLAKAGECNNYGWVIGDSDYCVYTNAKNKVSYVNGDTTRGSYGSAVFNGSINVEKTINDKWKAGVAYGMGSANLYDFNFSGTTANLNSSNNHYSVYGVKKVNDIFTLKGMVGGSVFDYKGKRNYSTTSATSAYETDGYTAEINGTWDIKKDIKNSKTPIRLQPTLGVAFAAHAQDGFSESGSGDLITVDPNQAEQLLFKTGIGVDKEIIMEGGKWLLVPSLALNYEMDTYAGKRHRDLKGGLTESTTAHTSVEAKTFGQHRGSVKVGADFVCTKNFMFNLNAEYGLATYGDENSYGGGFRWQF